MGQRAALRVVIAIALIVAGWIAGSTQAQVSEPDFEISVVAPVGRTEIKCLRGCNLKWVERGNSANSDLIPTFSYSCGGAGATSCASGKIGGWVMR